MYTKKYMDTTLHLWKTFSIPPSTVQDLDPTFVVLFSLGSNNLLSYLKRRFKYFNATFQMALGAIIIDLSFLFMIGASLERAHAYHPALAKSNLGWLVGAYFFRTMEEICFIPILFSFTTNMAPKGRESVIIGILFAVIGLSSYFASQLGALSISYGYLAIFKIACAIPLLVGLAFMLFNRKILAWTHVPEELKN